MADEVAQSKTQLPGYYTTEEAAQVLGYRDGTALRTLCHAGKITAYKVGKTWLIPAAWIDHAARQEVKPQGNRGVARK